MDVSALLLSGKDVKTEALSEIFIARENITEMFLSWDDTLSRCKDTRALILPLRVKHNVEGKTRTLYMHVKKVNGKIYGREKQNGI